MELYFAPLEGITGYLYRNVYHEFYTGVDKFFTPFLSPAQNRTFSPKETREILPENNKGMNVVPQILTDRADYFIRAALELKERYGYTEVNLNLGCPSGTVVAKGKGAGFLARKEELDRFFAEIFDELDMKVSVKTRIGMEAPEEFYDLIDIFNRYPVYELVIHPRVRSDYYKNSPNWKIFADAVLLSRNPLCYNGDIFTGHHYELFHREFPGTERVMLGRGLLADPATAEYIKEGKAPDREREKDRLKAFHDRLYAAYREEMSGETNVLFKMKEVWSYMIHSFTGGERYMKKIKKAVRLCDYEEVVRRLFAEQELTVK